MVGTTQLRRPRLFAIALVAAIGSTTIAASPAQAATQYFLAPNGIYYQYEEGGDFSTGASVKGYFGDPGVAVTIPETVTTPHGSFEVLHVMADGFRDAALSGMTIEADLHTIGNSGFRGAFTGGHLAVPDSVTTIAAAAFADNDLDGITLPSGLTELAGNLFDGSNLTSIDIPDGVTKIGARAFEGNQLDERRDTGRGHDHRGVRVLPERPHRHRSRQQPADHGLRRVPRQPTDVGDDPCVHDVDRW